MKRFARFLNLMVLTLTVGACTVTGKPYQEHESAKSKASGDTDIIARPESMKPSSEAANIEAQFKTAQDPLNDVLLPLAAKVLDPERITNKKSSTNRAVLDELMLFNRLILATTPEQRSSSEFKDLLKRYQSALSIECGEIIQSCAGYQYFKMSANSAQVAKLIAQNDPDNYFRMLLYAIELKNMYWDPDIGKMLFQNPAKNLSQAEEKRRETVRNLMATALQTERNKSQTPAAIRGFLDGISAWKFAEQDLSGFPPSTRADFFEMVAASRYMYAGEKGLDFHPDFQSVLTKAEANPDGFMALQKALREQKSFSAEGIGAKFISKLDELTYILDEVFTEKITAQTGATLFASTGKSCKEMEEAIQGYLRMRFLIALQRTSEQAKGLFNAKVQGQDLIWHFMTQSPAVAAVWSGFVAKANGLKNFGVLAMRTKSDTAAENRLKSLFESIPTSINLASAYPHALLLFHLLSQKHFQLVIPFSGRTLDSGDLMRMVFNSQLEPIVVYTEIPMKLNQFQLAYAFDMALRTNLFKTVNVNPDFFIADTLRRLTSDAVNHVNDGLIRISSRFKQAPSYSKFKDACAEITSGKPINREFYFTELDQSPYFGLLIEDAFHDLSDPKQMGLNYLDAGYAEIIEKARINQGNMLRVGQGMLEAYKLDLRKRGLSEDEIAEQTKLSREVINSIHTSRMNTLTLSKKWYDDIASCYYKAFFKDTEVQLKVVEAERAYFRQVHRDVKRLRAGVTESEKAAILKRIQFEGMPSGFKGLDRISADGYVISEVDVRIRIAKYLMEGLKTDEVTIPPIAPGLNISFGNKLDLDVPFVQTARFRPIGYVESADDFADSAFRAEFKGADDNRYASFLKWFTTGGNKIRNWADYLKSLVSVYRLEREIRGSNKDFTAEMILHDHEEVLKNLKMSQKEREVFSLIYAHERFDAMMLGHVLVKFNFDTIVTMDYWGLFDYPTRLVNEEILGDNWDALIYPERRAEARLSPQEAARIYYKSRSIDDRGASVVPYNRDLDRALDREVVSVVAGDIAASQEFHAATADYLKKITQRPADERPRADINMFLSVSSPLLSENLIPSYKAKLGLFNMDTNSCFTSDKTCVSFQQ